MMAPATIVESALAAGDEGLTFLGGEPVDQVEAVAGLARLAHESGLGVICFTGYTIEAVRSSHGGSELLRHVDLLIDGPYVAANSDTNRALVGSTNQRFVHLTDRYADYESERAPNRLDLRILPTGEVSIAGFVTTPRLVELADALEARRTLKP